MAETWSKEVLRIWVTRRSVDSVANLSDLTFRAMKRGHVAVG